MKLVGPDGRKLADDEEAAIEAALPSMLASEPNRDVVRVVTPARPGRRFRRVDLDAYVEHLLGALDGRTLAGLHVVVDCANGAASELAPRALLAAGARVDVLHAAPDGRNINDGVRLDVPARSCRPRCARAGADLGLALDGDADRVRRGRRAAASSSTATRSW